jgi:hypothetical protein
LIAAGLSCAFDDKESNCQRHFEAARDYVKTRQAERLQTAYLLAVLLTGAILAVVGVIAWTRLDNAIQREFVIAVSLGGLGAVVSVAQRFRSIVIERYGSLFFTAVAGIARVLFGGLFGFTFVILQKSGVVLAGTSGNTYAIAAASLAAGFSERLIPDLVGKIETVLTTGK